MCSGGGRPAADAGLASSSCAARPPGRGVGDQEVRGEEGAVRRTGRIGRRRTLRDTARPRRHCRKSCTGNLNYGLYFLQYITRGVRRQCRRIVRIAFFIARTAGFCSLCSLAPVYAHAKRLPLFVSPPHPPFLLLNSESFSSYRCRSPLSSTSIEVSERLKVDWHCRRARDCLE